MATDPKKSGQDSFAANAFQPVVDDADAPPFLSTWPRVYALTVIYALVWIALLIAFTRAFTP